MGRASRALPRSLHDKRFITWVTCWALALCDANPSDATSKKN